MARPGFDSRLIAGVAIAALTILTYTVFPGHTYLQSDSQIYVPMLERLWNPAALQRDLVAQYPHMGLTVYDEVALGLRRLTGLGYREVLTLLQLLCRGLGLLGVYLIARSFRLDSRPALMVTAISALGVTIWGPTVLTIEYEPVPRGFALPLVLLGIGLVGRRRYVAAGSAAAVAFLFHATAALPFWICYAVLIAWPAERALRVRRAAGMLPLLLAGALLALLAAGHPDSQHSGILDRLPSWWEQMLRLRVTYVWVSLWFPRWYWHYGILFLIATTALWRLRNDLNFDLGIHLAGLPLIGILSVPVSYWVLEVSKLTLGPRVQPARAVLFVALVAGLLSSVAGMRAAQAGRRPEAAGWLMVAFALPTGNAIQSLLFPDTNNPAILRRMVLVVLLALAAATVAWAGAKERQWAPAASAVLLIAPFFLYPGVGHVENFTRSDDGAVQDLAQWAQASTPADALFAFPDAGRSLYPGEFRTLALRAVYVDWKGGGQGNYVEEIAREWWNRWHSVMVPKFRPERMRDYATLGIEYVVLSRANRLAGETPLYENTSFLAYAVRRTRPQAVGGE
jgi:hypothetical protein